MEYVAQSGHQAFYDEAAGLIHIVEGRMVTAVALPTAAAAEGPTPAGAGSWAGLDEGSGGTPMLHTPRTDASGAATPAASPARAASPPLPLSTPPRGSHRRGVSDASSGASGASETPTRAFLAAEGGPIVAVRASLDGRYTALQRSSLQVEFVDHASGNMFIETPQ